MSVRVDPDGVRISDHLITEPIVVAEFTSAVSSGRDPGAVLLSLLSLGAQVAALGSSTTGAEKLEASIGQARASIKDAAEAFEGTIKKQVSAFSAEDGTLLKGLESIISKFRDDVDEMTAGEDSPLRTSMLKSLSEAQTRIREDIAGQVARQKSEIASLLDPSDPTSPLKTLADKIDGLSAAVTKVQEDIVKEVAVAEIVEVGVVGGFDYEEVAVQAVQHIAAAAGDDCERTGLITGRIPRSKVGDGVVDLKVGAAVFARVVLEAKNKALTKSEWEREAEVGKNNRAATGFIGLCKHAADMPNGNRILVLDTQSIVVAYDPEVENLQLLALVYQLVKLTTLSSTGQLDEINIAEVNKNLEDAVKALGKFDAITKQASAIRNSADAITKEANGIRNLVAERLQAAQSAITRGMTPEALEASTATPALQGQVA